jgi:hypothetical protein
VDSTPSQHQPPKGRLYTLLLQRYSDHYLKDTNALTDFFFSLPGLDHGIVSAEHVRRLRARRPRMTDQELTLGVAAGLAASEAIYGLDDGLCEEEQTALARRVAVLKALALRTFEANVVAVCDSWAEQGLEDALGQEEWVVVDAEDCEAR